MAKKRVIAGIAAVLTIAASAVGLAGCGGTEAETSSMEVREEEMASAPVKAVIRGDCQEVETELMHSSFGNIIVQKDIPVRFTIHAEKAALRDCNRALIMKDFGVEETDITEGDNLIEFTPTETGEFTYCCWMDMIHNTVTVVDDLDKV